MKMRQTSLDCFVANGIEHKKKYERGKMMQAYYCGNYKQQIRHRAMCIVQNFRAERTCQCQ